MSSVLIIGASSEIGRAVIRDIAREGMVILAQHRASAEALAELAADIPAELVPLQADLTSEADLAALIEAVAQRCDAPQQIVFLAAPRFELARFRESSWSDFQAQIDVQLRAPTEICRRFLPKMKATDKVVFVLSSYTLGAPPTAMAPYVVAKYAALGLMKALAAEYAAKKICINAVSPSMVETAFLADIPSKLVEIAAAEHPHRRNATPQDVAPAIAFLLSDAANFMTGANLPITGGAA